jgi:hypothetical protein
MKKVAIYTGRFQPFHKGHYSAYKHLVDKFGEENVYIATSDPKETTERDPFDFHGKKEIIGSMFDIPSERIVQVKNPYSPKEILSKYDQNDTQFITAVGEKDGDRLSGGKYFRRWDDSEADPVPYKKGGYFVTVPNFKVDGKVMSATQIRDKLGNPDVSMRNKIDFFKQLYGDFDKGVFKHMTSGIENGIAKSKEKIAQKKQEPEPKKGKEDPTDPTGVNFDQSALMKKVRNPQTRRDILVKTALNYDKDHPAYKLARKMFQAGPIDEIFAPILVENALINQYNALVDQYVVGEDEKKSCRIEPDDDYTEVEKKCKKAYKKGVFYYPLAYALRTADLPDDPNEDPQPEPVEKPTSKVSEEETSTARVRKYYKKNPGKVKAYLKKTQDDRVARNRDRRKMVKKHGKSKMKNHDVHHPNGPQNGGARLAKKDHGPDKKKKNEAALFEGGAAGHMMHPYEDMELTFGEYKDMISKGLVGSFGDDSEMTEKLDGQNIAFTVIDGEVRFARNKGHVKNQGQNSLTVKGIMDKFEGRGSIQRAFVGSAKDLEAAIKQLPPKEVKEMFKDGKKYMNTEIILPDSENVIPYGKSVLVFHGTIEYDNDGKQVDITPEDASTFNSQIKQYGQEQQKVFGIQGPHVITFSDENVDELEEKTREYHSEIDRLAGKIDADDNTPVSEYYRKWWENEVTKELGKIGVEPDVDQLDALVNRFAFGDKSVKAGKFPPDIKKWLSQYQKNVYKHKVKEARAPFEMLFLRAGNDSLGRIKDFLGSNNPGAVKQLHDELEKVKKALDGSQDLGDAAEKLSQEFERLEQIGLDKLVPSEGLVFMYDGRPYKFTGAFAPINQILGTFKFGTPQAQEPTSAGGQAPAAADGDRNFIKQFYAEKIRNPQTGKDITVQSALTYDKSHPAYKAAIQFLSGKVGKQEG